MGVRFRWAAAIAGLRRNRISWPTTPGLKYMVALRGHMKPDTADSAGTCLRALIQLHEAGQCCALGFQAADLSRLQITRVHSVGDTSERYVMTSRDDETDRDRRIFVKRYSANSGFRQDVANECRGLRLTHDAFATSAFFRAPEPYGACSEHQILFMEYCPSVNLNKVLFDRLKWSRLIGVRPDRPSLLVYATRLGSLLAELQAIPGASELVDDSASLQLVLRGYRDTMFPRLEACEAAGVPGGLLRRVRDYFCDNLMLPPSPQRLVPQHSDFGPWNILRGPVYLYLVDFHNFTTGLPAYDAAYFFTAVGLWTRYRTVSRTQVRRFQYAFLNAVTTQGGGWVHSPLFRALCLMHLAYLAPIVLSRRSPIHESLYLPVPRRRFIIECFRRHLGDAR